MSTREEEKTSDEIINELFSSLNVPLVSSTTQQTKSTGGGSVSRSSGGEGSVVPQLLQPLLQQHYDKAALSTAACSLPLHIAGDRIKGRTGGIRIASLKDSSILSATAEIAKKKQESDDNDDNEQHELELEELGATVQQENTAEAVNDYSDDGGTKVHKSSKKHKKDKKRRERGEHSSHKKNTSKEEHSKEKKRTDSRSKSRDKHRSRSSSRSKTSKSRTYRSHSRDKSSKSGNKRSKSRERRQKSRDRSGSREKGSKHSHRKSSRSHRSKSKERRRSRSRDRKRSKSRDKSRRDSSKDRHGSSRSRKKSDSSDRRRSSKSPSRHRKSDKSRRRKKSSGYGEEEDCVKTLKDKVTRKRLLEIARRNAVQMVANGQMPTTFGPLGGNLMPGMYPVQGKSVDDLTAFCKQLAESGNYSDDDASNVLIGSDDDDTSQQDHPPPWKDPTFSYTGKHPFAVKDRPIMMNIRNAPMLPTKSNAERMVENSKLSQQFPVSSGSHHRDKDKEWVPVEPHEKLKAITAGPNSGGGAQDSSNKSTNENLSQQQELRTAQSEKVFDDPEDSPMNIDLSEIVSERLKAMRQLQSNPNDDEAIKKLSTMQKTMSNWALSKQEPGRFTGSTDVKVLSYEELSSGQQAWASKGQLRSAAPVSSHFGLRMLQKMGWNPGEGLGKNKEGSTEPLMLDVKMDKKGFHAQEELTPQKPPIPMTKSLSGKHPVSALVEFCSKHKWLPPTFEVVFSSGPDHKKNYLMKVLVDNNEYKPSNSAPTKKLAKASAAAACLVALGAVPSQPPGTLTVGANVVVPSPVQPVQPTPSSVAATRPSAAAPSQSNCNKNMAQQQQQQRQQQVHYQQQIHHMQPMAMPRQMDYQKQMSGGMQQQQMPMQQQHQQIIMQQQQQQQMTMHQQQITMQQHLQIPMQEEFTPPLPPMPPPTSTSSNDDGKCSSNGTGTMSSEPAIPPLPSSECSGNDYGKYTPETSDMIGAFPPPGSTLDAFPPPGTQLESFPPPQGTIPISAPPPPAAPAMTITTAAADTTSAAATSTVNEISSSSLEPPSKKSKLESS